MTHEPTATAIICGVTVGSGDNLVQRAWKRQASRKLGPAIRLRRSSASRRCPTVRSASPRRSARGPRPRPGAQPRRGHGEPEDQRPRQRDEVVERRSARRRRARRPAPQGGRARPRAAGPPASRPRSGQAARRSVSAAQSSSGSQASACAAPQSLGRLGRGSTAGRSRRRPRRCPRPRRTARDPVERGIGEPRHRHGLRADDLAPALPTPSATAWASARVGTSERAPCAGVRSGRPSRRTASVAGLSPPRVDLGPEAFRAPSPVMRGLRSSFDLGERIGGHVGLRAIRASPRSAPCARAAAR